MSVPWMPLYVADYLADTGHLSASENGGYLLLLMHVWQKGRLPSDDDQRRLIARMSRPEWKRSRDTLSAYFFDGLPVFEAHFTHGLYRYVQAGVRRQVLDEAAGVCSYCGCSSSALEIDHVLPIAKGGSNDYENLAAACRSCNASKRDTLLCNWVRP